MKKILVLVCVLLSMGVTLMAQTNIPGGTLVDLDWTAAEDPYIIDGDILLQSGDELVIDPDVLVQFSGHFEFRIEGRLLAEGTDGNEITFTATVPATGWHGLRFVDTDINGQDSSKVVYCNLEYGLATGTGTEIQGGAIYCLDSSELLVRHCTIENNQATTGGGIYLRNSDVVIEDTVIDNNIATGSGGGIHSENSDPTLEDVEITNNNSVYDGGGINCHNSDATFDHVLIADNHTSENGGGIAAFNYSDTELINVTLSNNTADGDGCGIASLYGSTVTLINGIVWENDLRQIYVSSTGEFSVEYSDVDNGETGIIAETGSVVTWGDGNLDEDPIFIDAANGDYNIAATSPCINTGNPDSIYNDPDGTQNDMGAFFFYQAGITGLVEFSASGSGDIEDVVINITGTSTATTNPNADGYYYVSLGAGTYDVTATLTGFTSDPQNNITVLANQLVTDIDFTMTPILPGKVTGTVALNGTGFEGDVTISAGGESTSPYYVEAVPAGYYFYELEIAPGIYDVTASLEGYQDSTYTDIVVQSVLTTEDIDYVLEPLSYIGYINGIITLNGGTGSVENVLVYADTASTNPDATGEYTLTVLNATYDVHASLDGYATATYNDVPVIADETTTDVDITMLPWDIIPGTDYQMLLYVTTTLEGQFVVGDASNQLGAFGPGGLSDCRGTAVWVDGPHPLWLSSEHYWSLPGYWYLPVVSNAQGPGTENISFRLYETSTDAEYVCYEVIDFEDSETKAMDQTYPSTVETQQFTLTTNWNWISFNLLPANNSTEVIFDDLEPANRIYQVKYEGYSHTYFPPWTGDLNNIGNGYGLLVKMNDSFDPFELDGEKINPIITPLALTTGWNWIGYIPQTSSSVEDALVSIESSVEQIKTQTQSATFTNSAWVGNLTTMQPGVSYKIKMTGDAPLTYPGTSAFGSDAIRVVKATKPDHWTLMSGNESNMVVMADIELDGSSYLNPDKSVGVFDEAGECRAVGHFENDFWYFTIVGNNDADQLHLRIYDEASGEELRSSDTIEFITDGMLGTVNEPISIKFNADTPEIPAELSLGQNHPNPFNPSTSISYSLPTDQMIKLSIYNTKGQHVCDLVNEYQEAGNHHVTWDATEYSSGIYFYKLTSGNNTHIKKCLLIK